MLLGCHGICSEMGYWGSAYLADPGDYWDCLPGRQECREGTVLSPREFTSFHALCRNKVLVPRSYSLGSHVFALYSLALISLSCSVMLYSLISIILWNKRFSGNLDVPRRKGKRESWREGRHSPWHDSRHIKPERIHQVSMGASLCVFIPGVIQA